MRAPARLGDARREPAAGSAAGASASLEPGLLQPLEHGGALAVELVLDPARHAGARVANADVGEPGCGETRAEPAGLLGLLMGWWRVVISSGCP